MIFITDILFASAVAASLTMFLNYCMGKPGSEKFSPYEIFSFYTVWLSWRRLKQVDLYDQYSEQYHDNLKRRNSKHETISLKNDYKKIVYDAAEPFFTWERMAGMCPICFGFWVSLFCGLLYTFNFIHLAAIIVLSHIIIRLLAKIL